MVEQEIKNDYFKEIHKKSTIQNCRQFINDIYCSNSGENMNFLERIQYRLEPKHSHFEKDIHFLAEEAFNYKYENLVKSMNQKIAESTWNNHELMRYFKPESVIQIGQKLENLSDLEKLYNTSGKNYKCNIEEGKVYLIYIWTVYKPICKKQLSWLNEIFIRHNWDSSAKFISINTDKNREYAQKLIKLLHCDHMENLYIDIVKYPHHPLLHVTNKYGYPASILVNNDGLIDLCGNLYDINLEMTIENLLKRERKGKKTTEDNVYISKENNKKLNKLCMELNDKFKKYELDINANHLYSATIKIKKTYTTNKNNNFIDKDLKKKISKTRIAELNYCAHVSDMKFFEELFKDFYSIKNLKITSSVIETEEIPYDRSPICAICHNFCNEIYYKLFNSLNRQVITEEKKEYAPLNPSNPPPNTVQNNSININNTNTLTRNNPQNSITPNEINLNQTTQNNLTTGNLSTLMRNKAQSLAIKRKNRRTINNGGFYYISDDDYDDSDDDIEDKNAFFAYYYCTECKESYCYNCGNEITDVTETNKMHKHFLLYINSNNRYYMKYILPYNIKTNHEIDFKYFFENSKTEKLEDIASHYQCKCDSCLSFPIRTVRWKCANCVSKNICDECKTKLENKDEGYDDILWNMNHAGCDPLHHIFIKVLFDCFSY